jgi:hypothetical protein
MEDSPYTTGDLVIYSDPFDRQGGSIPAGPVDIIRGIKFGTSDRFKVSDLFITLGFRLVKAASPRSSSKGEGEVTLKHIIRYLHPLNYNQ